MFGTVLNMREDNVLSLKCEAYRWTTVHATLNKFPFFPDNVDPPYFRSSGLQKISHYIHELLQVVIYIQSPLKHVFHFVPFILLTLRIR